MDSLKTENKCSEYLKENKQFNVEAKRLELLLEDTLKKLEFAMTVIDLIENEFTTISGCLSPTDLFLLRKGFQKYIGQYEESWQFQKADERKTFIMAMTLNELESFFNGYIPETDLITEEDEYDAIKAFHILYENKKVNELASNYVGNISEGAFNFIQDLKFLFYSNIVKMKLTPEESTLKEEYLRQMYAHHDELLDYATVMHAETSKRVKKDIAFVKSKEGEMNICENKVGKMKKECEKVIERLGTEADKIMILDWKRSELKLECLLSQNAGGSQNLEMLRKKFAEEEREFRVKKYQTEQQLLAVLEQYDRDMQERQEVYEYKEEIFQRENEQLNQLQARYDEQTAEFNMMVKEKKEYEQRLVEGRLYELKCKMNARRIQRFYRNYKKLLSVHTKKVDAQKSQASKTKQKSSK